MAKNNYLIAGIVIVLAIALGGYISYSSYMSSKLTTPGALDSFVQCMKDKGVIFYGAFWCPHCQATKKMFGDSASKLPYVECSTSDGQNQTQVCKDKGIIQYPTWIFPDGSQLTGEHTLQELSDKSQCLLTSASSIPVSPSAASPAQ